MAHKLKYRFSASSSKNFLVFFTSIFVLLIAILEVDPLRAAQAHESSTQAGQISQAAKLRHPLKDIRPNWFGSNAATGVTSESPSNSMGRRAQMSAGFQQANQQFARHRASPLSICQLPENLVTFSKCDAELESSFKRRALLDFQTKLGDTSMELRQLITNYWDEFLIHSIELIQMAQRETRIHLNKLAPKQQHPRGSAHNWRYHSYEVATWRLYDTMINYLNSSYVAVQYQAPSSSHQDQQAGITVSLSGDLESVQSSANELNHEISAYIRRLHLIQAKRLLDQRLQTHASADNANTQVDLECLGANLATQSRVDSLLNELSGLNQVHYGSRGEWEHNQTILIAEQTKLSQSIRQSLEFARTLMSSLTLAREMFHNLTHRAADWMPHSSCHQALARMSHCQQCYPTGAQSLFVPACESYCLNVVRGCMNDIYELNRFWSDHVNLLARFRSNMIGMNNIENLMLDLHERIALYISKLDQQYNPSSTPASSNLQAQNDTSSSPKSAQETSPIHPLGNLSSQVSFFPSRLRWTHSLEIHSLGFRWIRRVCFFALYLIAGFKAFLSIFHSAQRRESRIRR